MNPTLRDNLRELARAATMFVIVFCIIAIFALSAGQGPSPRERTRNLAPVHSAMPLVDDGLATPVASSDDTSLSAPDASAASMSSDTIATAAK
jgi:hypothetical protein